MSNRFLEQRINLRFFVKLGKNASDTCAMLSEVCGGEAVKPNCINCSKRVHMSKSQMKAMLSAQPSLLCGNIEVVT
jgi:hypothetical protein